MLKNNNIKELINSPLEPIFKPKFNKSNIIIDNNYKQNPKIIDIWSRDGDNYKKNNKIIIRGDIKDEDLKDENSHISFCFMKDKVTCNNFLKYLSSEHKSDTKKQRLLNEFLNDTFNNYMNNENNRNQIIENLRPDVVFKVLNAFGFKQPYVIENKGFEIENYDLWKEQLIHNTQDEEEKKN